MNYRDFDRAVAAFAGDRIDRLAAIGDPNGHRRPNRIRSLTVSCELSLVNAHSALYV